MRRSTSIVSARTPDPISDSRRFNISLSYFLTGTFVFVALARSLPSAHKREGWCIICQPVPDSPGRIFPVSSCGEYVLTYWAKKNSCDFIKLWLFCTWSNRHLLVPLAFIDAVLRWTSVSPLVSDAYLSSVILTLHEFKGVHWLFMVSMILSYL